MKWIVSSSDGSATMNPSSSWSNYNNHGAEGFLTSYSRSSSYPYPNQHLKMPADSSLSNLSSARVNEMARTKSYPTDGEAISGVQNLGAGSCPYAVSRGITTFQGSSSNAGNVFFGQPVNEEQNGKTLPIGSYIESLNCLLCSPASKNKSAEEDDDISIILSECKNLLNFEEVGSAVSSRGSEKKISKERKINEAVSRAPYANNQRIEAKTKSNHQREPNESCDGFKLIYDKNLAKQDKSKSDKASTSSSNINFQQPSIMVSSSTGEPDSEAIEQMKEMIYGRASVFRPVSIREEVVEKAKRKKVRVSTDPQTVAARQRRERISERMRVLQRLVPGGRKMDTASMLDEAAKYLKFLRSQVKALEGSSHTVGCPSTTLAFSFNHCLPMQTYLPLSLPTHHHIHNSLP